MNGPWPSYDFTRFVDAILRKHPQEDPKLPFNRETILADAEETLLERERARVADQRRDHDREVALGGDGLT